MLNELCAEIRNYFVVKIHEGTFTINGGKIAPLDFLQEGLYFRIAGSVFNDGVYRWGSTSLPTDETFTGTIWAMAVPPDVIALADEIKAYCESDVGKASPYTSESFGGYSYTKATDENGVAVGWQKVFASRLKPYRRISVL